MLEVSGAQRHIIIFNGRQHNKVGK
jgi:hypothetical protein